MNLDLCRLADGTLCTHADGGYPLYYLCQDGGELCARCANENAHLSGNEADPQWNVIGADVNYEDSSLICDHCGTTIPAAYVD